MPAIVSRSASCSTFAGNSMNSRSQLTENFMLEDRRLACLGRHASSLRKEHARGQFAESRGKPDFGWQCCRSSVPSCELPQEPEIVLGEKANVWNIEQNHGEPVHPQAKGEAGPRFRIVSAVPARRVYGFENSRMNHPASANFNPLFAPFQCFRFYVYLETGFSEWKIMRSKTHRRICSEKFT